MIIGERNNQLIRIPARRACNGYYIRWYYNGWHYWFFLPGDHAIITEGERYRTISTRKILLSTGQITLAEAIAIRTILHTREVYLWTNSGWANIRIEPGTLNVYNNMVNGEELEFVAIIGSKEVSYDSGFSPVVQLQEVASNIEYCEVVIGTQVWMCYNWDAAHPGSKVYGDDESNRALFGGLYSWAQVMSPGFVPEGWHVPTRAEWQTLKDYLGGDAVAGGHLKSLGLTYWDTPNTDADDSVGFDARGSGYAYKNTFSGAVVYANKLKYTYFWTADEASSLNAYANLLRYNDSSAYELPTNKLLNYLSVRLISNDGATIYDDWFLPSIDELNLMFQELYQHGVGNFTNNYVYQSSSEINNTDYWAIYFGIGGAPDNFNKANNTPSQSSIRPVRQFTSTTAYSLRDVGPAGGRIFYKNGNDYMECANSDIGYGIWSNITDQLIGTTGTGVGTGLSNSIAIINQSGHTEGAAKLCIDLITYG